MINPFENLTELQKTKLFKKLESHTYKYNKNEKILSTLTNTNIICIMISGTAKILNTNYLGEETLIDELSENSVFGTNLSSIDNTENTIVATDNCEVIVFDYNKLIKQENLSLPYYNIFLYNLFQIFNKKIKENNDRIQIITKKSIRDKLLAFFESEYRKTRSQNIFLEMSLKDLSDYLSINRSAMFRELRNLKDENFIKVKRNKITLLYIPNIK